MPGAERLDAFMARANAAYYAARDPFADFTTAPEVSQIFGEVLGAWVAVTWDQLGRPDPFLLAEAGPGRGTLMADALRLLARVAPACRAAARVHLIETSRRLRAAQARAIPDATWHDELDGLPDGPLVLLANEFLDALPIRQFVRRNQAWAERWVQDGAFIERPATSAPDCATPDGAVVEVNDAALAFVQALAARGAVAVLLDYGPETSAPGESLQALRDGRPADPLAEPGSADLTAHVDFSALASVARRAGAEVHGPLPQGMFLARLGLFRRADALARAQPPAATLAILNGARRLAEPDGMGRLFKALCLAPPGHPVPPGFAP
jgi:SAM-dependent MidA family methyltransferase